MHTLWKVYCSSCTCTVTPLPALKAHASLVLLFDWMVSIYGRKIAAVNGAVGSQLLEPEVPFSLVLSMVGCTAAVNVNLLAQLSQTNRGSTDVLP